MTTEEEAALRIEAAMALLRKARGYQLTEEERALIEAARELEGGC